MTGSGPKSMFSVGDLPLRRPDPEPSADEIDGAARRAGFPDGPRRRGGHRRSIRTKQIHAWLQPAYREDIAETADRTGTTQGWLLECAWDLYREHTLKLPPLSRPPHGR